MFWEINSLICLLIFISFRRASALPTKISNRCLSRRTAESDSDCKLTGVEPRLEDKPTAGSAARPPKKGRKNGQQSLIKESPDEKAEPLKIGKACRCPFTAPSALRGAACGRFAAQVNSAVCRVATDPSAHRRILRADGRRSLYSVVSRAAVYSLFFVPAQGAGATRAAHRQNWEVISKSA